MRKENKYLIRIILFSLIGYIVVLNVITKLPFTLKQRLFIASFTFIGGMIIIYLLYYYTFKFKK